MSGGRFIGVTLICAFFVFFLVSCASQGKAQAGPAGAEKPAAASSESTAGSANQASPKSGNLPPPVSLSVSGMKVDLDSATAGLSFELSPVWADDSGPARPPLFADIVQDGKTIQAITEEIPQSGPVTVVFPSLKSWENDKPHSLVLRFAGKDSDPILNEAIPPVHEKKWIFETGRRLFIPETGILLGNTFRHSYQVSAEVSAVESETSIGTRSETGRVIRPSGSGVSTEENPWPLALTRTLAGSAPDQTLTLRVRAQRASGALGSWTTLAAYKRSGDKSLSPRYPKNGETILSSRAWFEWQDVSAAQSYTVEISADDPGKAGFSAASVFTAESAVPGTAIGLDRLRVPPKSGAFVYWRAIAHTGDGDLSSDWQAVRFRPYLDDTVTVLPVGQNGRFTLGRGDQTVDVTLTRPYALRRTFTSNDEAAVLFNLRLREGLATIQDGQVRDSETGDPLLGLGDLDYGAQFGLGPDPTFGIATLKGHESHPLVGLSWFGAEALCEEASRLLGLSGEEVFRLPSEAEWEYAATARGQAAAPWLGSVQAATVNYLRSRDPFEDVVPPYTRRGGPTVPDSYYESARLAQFSAKSRTMAKAQGSFDPSAPDAQLATLDMLGNVWEWCQDWFAALPASAQTDPSGPPELGEAETRDMESRGMFPSRVVRGGAWNSVPSDVSAQNRGQFPPAQESFSIGLRMAIGLSAP